MYVRGSFSLSSILVIIGVHLYSQHSLRYSEQQPSNRLISTQRCVVNEKFNCKLFVIFTDRPVIFSRLIEERALNSYLLVIQMFLN